MENMHFTPWHLRDRTRGWKSELARTVQSNFFYSFLFLPKHKRQAIIDIYSFCREIDDIVDEIDDEAGSSGTHRSNENSNRARQALDQWRAELDRVFAGRPTSSLGIRIRNVLDQFPMPQNYFNELILGCEMDLDRKRYETFDDLYQYCYRVASITGLMCVEIFTYQSVKTREYAVNLGIALQLTNILRDLKEDAGRGRIYLPQEDLRRFGHREEDLLAGLLNNSHRDLMKFEVARARDYYRQADDALPVEDRSTLTAAITMGKIYSRLLDQIEEAEFDVFNHEIRLHRPERFIIALGEWARAGIAGHGA